MKPLKVLDAIDEEGQVKEHVYEIGPLTHMGANLMHGNNYADCVDCQGLFNILRYLQDFKEYFPALYHVGVGQFCPHTTTDVDCESLFSQAGFLSEPRQERLGIRMYEHLVVGKHRLNRIHCSIPIVTEIFMKLRKDNSWE